MANLSATTEVVAVQGALSKEKSIVLAVTPTTTSDVITFDQSTNGVLIKTGVGFNRIVAAHAVDSSTGMPKAISHNGSTVLTTVGWALGDNKWHIFVRVTNDYGSAGVI